MKRIGETKVWGRWTVNHSDSRPFYQRQNNRKSLQQIRKLNKSHLKKSCPNCKVVRQDSIKARENCFNFCCINNTTTACQQSCHTIPCLNKGVSRPVSYWCLGLRLHHKIKYPVWQSSWYDPLLWQLVIPFHAQNAVIWILSGLFPPEYAEREFPKCTYTGSREVVCGLNLQLIARVAFFFKLPPSTVLRYLL